MELFFREKIYKSPSSFKIFNIIEYKKRNIENYINFRGNHWKSRHGKCARTLILNIDKIRNEKLLGNSHDQMIFIYLIFISVVVNKLKSNARPLFDATDFYPNGFLKCCSSLVFRSIDQKFKWKFSKMKGESPTETWQWVDTGISLSVIFIFRPITNQIKNKSKLSLLWNSIYTK